VRNQAHRRAATAWRLSMSDNLAAGGLTWACEPQHLQAGCGVAAAAPTHAATPYGDNPAHNA